MGPTIAVIGSSNTDLVVPVRELPQPGETVLGGDLLTAAGGKGANQAVAAARLGAEVYFVGCVGGDRFGEDARAGLAREGLRLDHLRTVPDAPSGVALITVAASGQNSIVVAPGANARLTLEDVELAAPALRAAQVVVAQLEVPIQAVTRGLAIAREARVTTLLNPSPARPLDDALLSLVDILICNETEAEALTGMDAASTEAAARAAGALLRRGPRMVVLTRGEQGCVVAEGSAVTHLPAFAVQAVDTTAAGDAFVGALACRLAGGATGPEAARYASAAAALSVQRAGAQPSLPTAAEVAAFLRQGHATPDGSL
jgi:ribokinase